MVITAKVKRRGNSLFIIIPEETAHKIGLHKGDDFRISSNGSTATINLMRKKRNTSLSSKP